MELQIVDAHLHLWDPSRLTYPWLSEVPEINQPFGLEAFHAQSDGITVNKMVFIQCECLPGQYLDEVNYITKLSASDPRIQGIIPASGRFCRRLKQHKQTYCLVPPPRFLS